MVDCDVILRKRGLFKIGIIVAAFIATIILTGYSVISGTIKFSLNDVLNMLKGSIDNGLVKQIILNVRIPRILTGLLVGMNSATAGVLLQGILRNPMASPNIIGVNAGAGLAAVFIMIIVPDKINLIPMMAFLGALVAALLVYGISVHASNRSTTVNMILAGVALSAFFRAITSTLMFLNSDELAITYTWLLGSLSGRSWTYFRMIFPYSFIGLAVAIYLSPKVNLFGLGDEVVSSIGLSVKVYRIIITLTAAVLAGSAVSVAGTIGFIGLMAPHMARLLVGGDHKYLVPLSAILGGFLLVLSDTIARTIFQPVELSVGIITSTLGAPFFLFLLYKKGKNRTL